MTAWKRDTAAVIAAFAHPLMESLEVNTLAVTTASLGPILSHFGGDPIHLEASTRTGEYLYLTLKDLSRSRSRTFSHPLRYTDDVDAEMFNGCLAPLVSQIVRLTVHRNDKIWGFAVHILSGRRMFEAALPNVERLSVVLGYEEGDMRDDDERFSMHSRAGHCCFHATKRLVLPSLKCVELVGPAEDPLRARDLAEFMGTALGRAARRDLLLILNGVQIEGDLRPIWGYFERIELVPCQ
ncbi:hypothetical protein AURDEDRAFT_171937 [Auricularia subglabra TFB-10046 SS5]|nr:hypothetical protein AURDEDRAFT_171937 [Auricularia subglabra TFB-10046 SS5]